MDNYNNKCCVDFMNPGIEWNASGCRENHKRETRNQWKGMLREGQSIKGIGRDSDLSRRIQSWDSKSRHYFFLLYGFMGTEIEQNDIHTESLRSFDILKTPMAIPLVVGSYSKGSMRWILY